MPVFLLLPGPLSICPLVFVFCLIQSKGEQTKRFALCVEKQLSSLNHRVISASLQRAWGWIKMPLQAAWSLLVQGCQKPEELEAL